MKKLAHSLLALKERESERERGGDEVIHHHSVLGSDTEPHATPHKSHSNCQSCKLPSPISLFPPSSLFLLSLALTTPQALRLPLSNTKQTDTHTNTYCFGSTFSFEHTPKNAPAMFLFPSLSLRRTSSTTAGE